MKATIKKLIASTLIVLGLVSVTALAAATPTYAFDLGLGDGAKSAQGKDQQGDAGCLFGTEEGCTGQGIFRTVTNVLLFIIGAVSVIMLILGGFKYTTSNGDQAQVTSAKNTIMYSIIGVIVAILAFAAVNFVITSFAQQ